MGRAERRGCGRAGTGGACARVVLAALQQWARPARTSSSLVRTTPPPSPPPLAPPLPPPGSRHVPGPPKPSDTATGWAQRTSLWSVSVPFGSEGLSVRGHERGGTAGSASVPHQGPTTNGRVHRGLSLQRASSGGIRLCAGRGARWVTLSGSGRALRFACAGSSSHIQNTVVKIRALCLPAARPAGRVQHHTSHPQAPCRQQR